MESQQVTIDEALLTIGEFGRGQLRQFCLVSLVWIPAAIQTLVTVFLAQDPVSKRWWRCTDPGDQICQAALAAPEPDVCGLPREAWQWTRRRRSVISQFDLVCGEDWGAQAVNSAYFVGFLVGAGLWGALSDRVGRRKALFATVTASLAAGVASALSPDFQWYAALRALTGFGNSGIGIVAFVLALEPVGSSWRGTCGIIQGCFFTLGACLTALMAWAVRAWRPLMVLAALPMAAYLLLWPAIHESPRWLLVAGRKGEATAALAAIAVGNRTKLPEAPLADMGNSSVVRVSLWDVIQHPRLRMRLLIMVYVWFVVSLCYYGSAFGMGQLAGSIYMNFVAIYAIELPAYAASGFLIDRVGRRPVLVYSLLECAAALLSCAFTRGWLQRLLAIASKFGVAAAYNLCYIWTEEMFPTTVRNTALGFCSQLGHVGAMVAPGIVFLGTLAGTKMVPFLAFGSVTLIAGMASAALPETLGTATLETVSLVPTKPSAAEARMDLLGGQAAPRKWSWAGVRHLFRGRSGWVRLPGAEDVHD